MLAAPDPTSHEREPHPRHDRPHVGEVEVDHSRHEDQVGDSLYRLLQDGVRHPEGVLERCALLDDGEKPLVGNRQEGVHDPPQLLDPGFRLAGPAVTLEGKRLRDHRHGQRAEFLRHRGDDRGRSCARAAAHAGGDEHHVGPDERLLQDLAILGRRATTDIGVGASAETARELRPELELDRGRRGAKRLGVGVGHDEGHTREARGDHAVHRVRATPAQPDDLDLGGELLVFLVEPKDQLLPHRLTPLLPRRAPPAGSPVYVRPRPLTMRPAIRPLPTTSSHAARPSLGSPGTLKTRERTARRPSLAPGPRTTSRHLVFHVEPGARLRLPAGRSPGRRRPSRPAPADLETCERIAAVRYRNRKGGSAPLRARRPRRATTAPVA